MIDSPTITGKTYTTVKTLEIFPEDDVWNIGDMSPKALIHMKGVKIQGTTYIDLLIRYYCF